MKKFFLFLLSLFISLSTIAGPDSPKNLRATIDIVNTNKYLIVVESLLYPYITNFTTYRNHKINQGWEIETVLYDSSSPGGINVSSFKAKYLATNIIWPKVTNGFSHIFMIGELPVAVSGIDVCPDGHAGDYTDDGWRGSQNSAGAYRSTQFYGYIGNFGFTPGYTDSIYAELSMNTGRQNRPGDGRFDNSAFTGMKARAAVGWFGGFNDQDKSVNGLIRRAQKVIDYLNRVMNYENGVWVMKGAGYEYVENFNDPHANQAFLEKEKTIYGATNVVIDLVHQPVSSLTNRPTAFNILWTGSDWGGTFIPKLNKPFTAIAFLHLSFSKELPGVNRLSKLLLDSPNYGPISVINWSSSARTDILDLAAGKTVGQMFMLGSARGAGVGVEVGFYGDPTIRITLN